MTDFETARDDLERFKKEMREIWEKDRTIRRTIDECVHLALSDMREPEMEDVYRACTEAVTMMAARLLSEDARVNALRIERDMYRKQAEAFRFSRPLQIFIPGEEKP